jgi:hypothetical protein
LEEEEEEEEEKEEHEGGEMKWRDNVGLTTNGQKQTLKKGPSWTKSNAFSPPSSSSLRASSSSSSRNKSSSTAQLSEEEVRENALQDRQLEAISKLVKSEAEEERNFLKAEKESGGSDVKLTVNRFRHIVFALKTAMDNEMSSSTNSVSSIETSINNLLSLKHVLSLRADQLGSLTELGPLLKQLRACAHGASRHGAIPPTLRDYSLTEKDINDIADAAEVDENTLSSLVTLKHRDIVDLLKRS